MGDVFTPEAIIPLFKETCSQNEILSLLPDELVELIPQIDENCFSIFLSKSEDVVKVLHIQPEVRNKLIKYIYDNQNSLINGNNSIEVNEFIGTIIIESFLALDYNDISSISSDIIRCYISLLIVSFSLVPKYSRENNLVFLVFLCQITALPTLFENMQDIQMYISSAPVFSPDLIVQSISYLDAALKIIKKGDNITSLHCYVFSLSRRIQNETNLSIGSTILKSLLHDIMMLTKKDIDVRIYDAIIPFRGELMFFNDSDFIELLCNCSFIFDDVKLEKFQLMRPTTLTIDECFDYLPKSVVNIGLQLSRISIRAMKKVVETFLNSKINDNATIAIELVFLLYVKGKINVKEMLGDSFLNFFFRSYIFNPNVSIFDGTNKIIAILRQLTFHAYKSIMGALSEYQFLTNFIPFISILIEHPNFFAEFLYYSQIVINFSGISYLSIESFLQVISGVFLIQDNLENAIHLKETIALEIAAISVFSSANNFSSEILGSKLICDSIVGALGEKGIDYFLKELFFNLFSTDSSPNFKILFKSIEDRLKGEKTTEGKEFIFSLIISTVFESTQRAIHSFFESDLFNEMMKLAFDNPTEAIIVSLCKVTIFVLNPLYKGKVGLDAQKVYDCIEKFGITDIIYESLKNIIFGNSTVNSGISCVETIEIDKMLLKSSYRHRFIEDMQAILSENPYQKTRAIRSDLFHLICESEEVIDARIINLFSVIADMFTTIPMIFDLYQMFKRTNNMKHLLVTIKNLFVMPAISYKSLFCFSSASNPITFHVSFEEFTFKTRIMLCSDACNLFVLQTNDSKMIINMSTAGFALTVGNKGNNISYKMKNNRWLDVTIDISLEECATFKVADEEVGTLQLSDLLLTRGEQTIALFDSSVVKGNNCLVEVVNIICNGKNVYEIDPLHSRGDLLFSNCKDFTHVINFDSSIVYDIGSFKSKFIAARGIEFLLVLSSTLDEGCLLEIIQILQILMSYNDEAQNIMKMVKGFEVLASSLNALDDVSSNTLEELFKFDDIITSKSLLYSFHTCIYFDSFVWIKNEDAYLLLIKKWNDLQTNNDEAFRHNISVQRAVYCICMIMKNHKKNIVKESIYLLSIIRCFGSIHVTDRILDILFTLLVQTRNEEQIPFQVLHILSTYVIELPKYSGKILTMLFNSIELIETDRPLLPIMNIQQLFESGKEFRDNYLSLFIKSMMKKPKEQVEEFAAAFCSSMVGLTTPDSIANIAKMEEYPSISSYLVPFVCILSLLASHETLNLTQDIFTRILTNKQYSESISMLDSSLTILSFTCLLLLPERKMEALFVDYVTKDLLLLPMAFVILSLIYDYIDIDAYGIEKEIVTSTMNTLFNGGTPDHKNFFVRIITSRLLYACRSVFETRNGSEKKKSIVFDELITLISKRSNDEDKFVYGPRIINGEWIDKDVAVELLEHSDDADLNNQSIRDLIILQLYVMSSERKSSYHHMKSLNVLMKRSSPKELSILFYECSLQKKAVEENAPEFYQMFSCSFDNNSEVYEALNNELDEFYRKIERVSDYDIRIRETYNSEPVVLDVSCPKLNNLVSYMEKKHRFNARKFLLSREKIQRSFTFDDSPYVFTLEKEDTLTKRHQYDQMLRPFLFTNKIKMHTFLYEQVTNEEKYFTEIDLSDIKWVCNGTIITDNGETKCIAVVDDTSIVLRNEIGVLYQIKGSSIMAILPTWWHGRANAVSIYIINMPSVILEFGDISDHSFIEFIKSIKVNEHALVLNSSAREMVNQSGIITRWKRRLMSTYEYIHWLNIYSGRTFLSEELYPIYPWVSVSFDNELRASDVRQFDKNINYLNKERVESIRKEKEIDAFDKDSIILFSRFVSTRKSTKLCLFKEGEAKNVKELFNDLVSKNEDAYELPEEYFYAADVFRKDIHPGWASSSFDFVEKNKVLLERDDSNIEKWIDMIFGIGQSGQTAEKMNSTYDPRVYPLSYETEKDADEYIKENGCFPQQIFDFQHCKRIEAKDPPPRTIARIDMSNIIAMISTKSRVIMVNAKTYLTTESGIIRFQLPRTIYQNSIGTFFATSKQRPVFFFASGFDEYITKYDPSLHDFIHSSSYHCNITALSSDNRHVYAGCNDGSVLRISAKTMKVKFTCNFGNSPIINLSCSPSNSTCISVDREGKIRFFTTHEVNMYKIVDCSEGGKYIRTVFAVSMPLVFIAFEKYLYTFTASGELVKRTNVDGELHANDYCLYTNPSFVEQIAYVTKSKKLSLLGLLNHKKISTIAVLKEESTKVMFRQSSGSFVCSGNNGTYVVPENGVVLN